jgi:hypothetical protein
VSFISKSPSCNFSRSLTNGSTRPSLAAHHYTVWCVLQGSFRLKYSKRQLKEIQMTSFPDFLSVIWHVTSFFYFLLFFIFLTLSCIAVWDSSWCPSLIKCCAFYARLAVTSNLLSRDGRRCWNYVQYMVITSRSAVSVTTVGLQCQ